MVHGVIVLVAMDGDLTEAAAGGPSAGAVTTIVRVCPATAGWERSTSPVIENLQVGTDEITLVLPVWGWTWLDRTM